MTHHLQRLAWLALAAYLLTMPYTAILVDRWTGHDVARAAQLPLMLLCALACCVRPLRMSAASLATGLTAVLLAAMAVTRAARPDMALRELGLFVGMGVVAVAVSQAAAGSQMILRLATSAIALYATTTLLVALAAVLSSPSPSRIDMFPGYDNPRFMSHVLTAALPIALALRVDPRTSGRWKRLADYALWAAAALVFIAAGRATMVALMAGAAAAWLIGRRQALPVVGHLLAALAAGALIFALLFVVLPSVMHGQAAPAPDYAPARLGSDEARTYLWQTALMHIQASPWFGIGPMHQAHLPNLKAAHPHNLPLQIGAEWGLPMAALLACVGAAALAGYANRLRRTPEGTWHQARGTALGAGLVAVLVDSLFSGNVVMPVSQIWIAVLAGLAHAWWRDAGGPPAHAETRPVVVSRAPGVLALLLLMVAFVPALAEIRGLPQTMVDLQALHPTERIQPRFWSSGRF